MPRPTQGYRNADGKRVPGNTSIGEMWGANKRQLMHWANKMGLEGKTLQEAQEHEATIGTIIHKIVENELHNRAWPDVEITDEQRSRIENALIGFYNWRDSSLIEIEASEVEIVSEVWQFGTTLDHPGRVKGRRRIVELKTADGLYETMLIQVAAQGAAWDEKHPDDLVDGFDILRIGKGDGSFHHDFFPRGAPRMIAAWESFKHLRALYDLAKELK